MTRHHNLTDPSMANDAQLRVLVACVGDVTRRLERAMEDCPAVDVHGTALGICEMMSTVARLSTGDFGLEHVTEYSRRVGRFGEARDRLAAVERSAPTRIAEA